MPITPSEPLPLVVEPNQDNAQKSLSEESGGGSTGVRKVGSSFVVTARCRSFRGCQAGLWSRTMLCYRGRPASPNSPGSPNRSSLARPGRRRPPTPPSWGSRAAPSKDARKTSSLCAATAQRQSSRGRRASPWSRTIPCYRGRPASPNLAVSPKRSSPARQGGEGPQHRRAGGAELHSQKEIELAPGTRQTHQACRGAHLCQGH